MIFASSLHANPTSCVSITVIRTAEGCSAARQSRGSSRACVCYVTDAISPCVTNGWFQPLRVLLSKLAFDTKRIGLRCHVRVALLSVAIAPHVSCLAGCAWSSLIRQMRRNRVCHSIRVQLNGVRNGLAVESVVACMCIPRHQRNEVSRHHRTSNATCFADS